MPSRAAAVRELLRLGLSVEGILIADGTAKSGDFGVVVDMKKGANDRDARRGTLECPEFRLNRLVLRGFTVLRFYGFYGDAISIASLRYARRVTELICFTGTPYQLHNCDTPSVTKRGIDMASP